MGKGKRIAILACALAAVAWTQLAAAPASAKGADSRVVAALDRQGIEYDVNDSGNVSVTYEQDEGRSQTVYVMSATETYNDVEIREIWSNAGEFESEPSAEDLANLLVDSGKNKIGAWALEENDGGSYLLYYSMRFPAEVSDEALRMMLEFASSVADQAEMDFFDGADEN